MVFTDTVNTPLYLIWLGHTIKTSPEPRDNLQTEYKSILGADQLVSEKVRVDRGYMYRLPLHLSFKWRLFDIEQNETDEANEANEAGSHGSYACVAHIVL